MADRAAELAAIRAESAALRAELGMAEPEPTAEEGTPAMVVDPSKFTHRMGCVPSMVSTDCADRSAPLALTLICPVYMWQHLCRQFHKGRVGRGRVSGATCRLCDAQPLSTYHFLTGVHATGMAQLSRP